MSREARSNNTINYKIFQKREYPDWHKKIEDAPVTVRRKSLIQFYIHKIDEKERPEESEEAQKWRNMFFDPKKIAM